MAHYGTLRDYHFVDNESADDIRGGSKAIKFAMQCCGPAANWIPQSAAQVWTPQSRAAPFTPSGCATAAIRYSKHSTRLLLRDAHFSCAPQHEGGASAGVPSCQ